MLDLIQPLLENHGLDYVRLDGSVPQKQRQPLVHRFQHDAACRLFVTTNAGSTGLNLQSADTVINVDLPWNPAKLEQRIGRAHRIGQKKAVNVINLVVENTIEERVLEIIYQKQQLFAAMFDTDIDEINLAARSRVAEMRELVRQLLEAPQA